MHGDDDSTYQPHLYFKWWSINNDDADDRALSLALDMLKANNARAERMREEFLRQQRERHELTAELKAGA